MSKINLNRKPEDGEFFLAGDRNSIMYIAGLLDEVGIFDEHFNYLDDGTVEIIVPKESHELAIERSPEYRQLILEGRSFSFVREV